MDYSQCWVQYNSYPLPSQLFRNNHCQKHLAFFTKQWFLYSSFSRSSNTSVAYTGSLEVVLVTYELKNHLFAELTAPSSPCWTNLAYNSFSNRSNLHNHFSNLFKLDICQYILKNIGKKKKKKNFKQTILFQQLFGKLWCEIEETRSPSGTGDRDQSLAGGDLPPSLRGMNSPRVCWWVDRRHGLKDTPHIWIQSHSVQPSQEDSKNKKAKILSEKEKHENK